MPLLFSHLQCQAVHGGSPHLSMPVHVCHCPHRNDTHSRIIHSPLTYRGLVWFCFIFSGLSSVCSNHSVISGQFSVKVCHARVSLYILWLRPHVLVWIETAGTKFLICFTQTVLHRFVSKQDLGWNPSNHFHHVSPGPVTETIILM